MLEQATIEPKPLAVDEPKRPDGFVFGVGMPLTGEDELAKALRQFGYKVREGAAWHWRGALAYLDRGQGDIATRCLRDGHNAWVGWPVVIYQRLFQRYPEARYVLTECHSADWLARWQERQEWLRDHGRWLRSRAGRIEVATTKHLFGELHPSTGHAEHTYCHWTLRVEEYLWNHDARFCVLNVDDEMFPEDLLRFLESG